jgi:esterase/lipase superfamily enzyme
MTSQRSQSPFRRRVWIGLLVLALLLLALVITACAVGGSKNDATRFTDVLFVTDRANRADDPDQPRFGGQRGGLTHGRCEVRFRDIPLTRGLARTLDTHVPTVLRDVHRVEPLTAQSFDTELATLPADRPIVLFVHGYAYGFGRACRQSAQLQRRLGERATVVLFTWPSDGNPMDYGSDRGDAEWAALDFAELLVRIESTVGSERLRLAAHSLGSRTVLDALVRLRLEQGVREWVDHLVLLAPDFDTARFESLWPLLAPMVRHATLYASDNDRPLGVSASLHDQPRLGQAGDALTVLDGLQTVDVSPLGRYHPTGHEYHRYHPIAEDDFIALLLGAADAGAREHIRRRTEDGATWFELVTPVD